MENIVFKPFRENYLTESMSHFVSTYTLDFKAINRQEFDPKSFKPITIPNIHHHLVFPKGQETQTIIFKNWIKAVFPLSESKIKALVPQNLRHEFEANKNALLMAEGSLATTEVTRGEEEMEQESSGISSLKEYLKDSINSFFRRMEALREEGTAKNAKMKAFTDLLKFIKELGINEASFKDRLDLEQMQEEGSMAEIKESVVNLFATETKELTTRLGQSADKIFKYTRRSKDYQNVIRSNKSFCPEISMEDLRRSHGFINSLWDYNCTMRAHFTALLERATSFSKTKKQVLYIENALKQKEEQFVWANDKLKKALKDCTNGKDDLLLQLDQFDQVMVKMKMTISEQVKGKLQELRLTAKELTKVLEPIMPLAVVGVTDISKLKSNLVILKEICVSVDKLLPREESGDVFLLGLLDKLCSQVKHDSLATAHEIEAVLNEAQGMVTELSDGKPFEEAVKQISLYLQNMAKQQNKYSKVLSALAGDENAEPLAANDPRKTFSKNEERQWGNITEVLRTLLENLKVEQIFPTTCFTFGGNTKDLLLQLSAALKVAGLVVSSGTIYCFQTQKTLDKFNYLVSTVVYNLTYKGFCSPPGQEGDDDGDGKGDFKAADGTGIGEGQGMENVSKEIEFEEQVLGERHDEEKVQPQDQRKVKEEKEAVDMENDFEGDNYDKDKDEENQMDEEENPDDQDDEFSSVDNEFDYKMWHDEKKDEGEEEEEEDDNGGGGDENMSMSEEEKLEFHDEEEKGETEARAKDNKKKEKSETRQAKDYDAFKPEEEEKDKDNINEQEPQDNMEEEEKKDDEKGDYRKGENDEKEEQKEPNDEQKDLDIPDDGDEKVSFESEPEADLEKDENKSAKLDDDEEGAEDMEEEAPQKEPETNKKDDAQKDQEMDIENEGAKKDGEEIEEEEGEKEENKEKDFSSKPQQQKNQGKKPEMGKQGFKNEVREDDKPEEEKQEQQSGVNQEEQMQKEGKLFGDEAMQTEEKGNNTEDFVKKLIENLNSVAMSEEMKENLDNFIKDLNIVRENLEEQTNTQPDKRTQSVLEDPKMAENMLFEAVQQSNQSDSFKNSLKTNAPTSTNPSMQMNSSSNQQEQDAGEFVSDMNPEMTTENEQFEKPNAKKEMQEETKQESKSQNQVKESQSKDKASALPSLPRETKSLVEKAQKDQIEKVMQETPRREENKNELTASNRMEIEPTKKQFRIQQDDPKNQATVPLQASKTHQELKEQLEDLISQWKLDSLNQEEGLKVMTYI